MKIAKVISVMHTNIVGTIGLQCLDVITNPLKLPVTWAPVSMLAMRRQACSYVEAKDTWFAMANWK
jgi:hypothetical protein